MRHCPGLRGVAISPVVVAMVATSSTVAFGQDDPAAPVAQTAAPVTPAAAEQPSPGTAAPAPVPTPAPVPAPAPVPEPPAAEPEPPVAEGAAVTESPAEEGFKPSFNIGMGLRAGVDAHLDDPTAVNVEGNVRPYMWGAAHENVKWTVNLDAVTFAKTGPTDVTDAAGDSIGSVSQDKDQVAVLDAIVQFEFNDLANFWIGRMLPPSDRANLSGPYFQNAWHYPVHTNLYPTLPAEGRDNGVTYWGQLNKGAFKWQLGLFGLDRNREFGTDAPLGYLRLTANFLEPEPGYYNSSTYYGKDILALAAVLNTHPNYNGEEDMGTRFNLDFLFEKNLGEKGVLDIEAAYYNFEGTDEGSSVLASASYLYNGFQPMVRLQQAIGVAAPGGSRDSTTVDAALNYILDGHNARVTLNYQLFTGEVTDADDAVAEVSSSTLTLGGQIQYW